MGRRLPLMLERHLLRGLSVLSGLAPSYGAFLGLRMLFGIGMGGEWGVGASLALESASPRLARAALRPAAGRLRARQSARSPRVPAGVPVLQLALSRERLAVDVFPRRPAGAPVLFIRSRVKESAAWHEHRTDWATYRKSPAAVTGAGFCTSSLLMTMMNFMSHGTQDMYPTLLRHNRLQQGTGSRT